jgi:DNA repair exonuclease SbcCD ATPase subunit
MTITIKDLSVKNFMSVGNVSQAVDFTTENLTLVLGENLDQGGDDAGSRNGTGKTTIINALSYALYGQALTNIKKGNLINKTNSKGMIVTLRFEKNGVEYRIERGRSPTFTKFYINNQEFEDNSVDESQGDSRKTQETINDLLGMSHDMFKHIVALNTYSEPFLNMRTNDQRAIIEQLLGITLLSEKANTLKDQIKQTKDAITEETLRLNAINASNEKINASIKSFETRQSAWRVKQREDCEKLRKSIEELEHLNIEGELENHDLLANWTKINTEIKNLKKEQSTLELAQSRAITGVQKIAKEVEELDNATCYACGQALHEDKKQQILNEKEQELIDNNKYLSDIDIKLEKIQSRLAELGDLNAQPRTFYETAKKHMSIATMLRISNKHLIGNLPKKIHTVLRFKN